MSQDTQQAFGHTLVKSVPTVFRQSTAAMVRRDPVANQDRLIADPHRAVFTSAPTVIHQRPSETSTSGFTSEGYLSLWHKHRLLPRAHAGTTKTFSLGSAKDSLQVVHRTPDKQRPARQKGSRNLQRRNSCHQTSPRRAPSNHVTAPLPPMPSQVLSLCKVTQMDRTPWLQRLEGSFAEVWIVQTIKTLSSFGSGTPIHFQPNPEDQEIMDQYTEVTNTFPVCKIGERASQHLKDWALDNKTWFEGLKNNSPKQSPALFQPRRSGIRRCTNLVTSPGPSNLWR